MQVACVIEYIVHTKKTEPIGVQAKSCYAFQSDT